VIPLLNPVDQVTAFQIAVALAEAADEKDDRGRIVLRPKHIEETVKLSSEFREYLKALHRKDDAGRAALRGNRLDAFGTETEASFN
jgi:hypothetical protein